MKTSIKCLTCFLRQAEQVTEIVGCTADMRFKVVQEVAALFRGMDREKSPVANAGAVYECISHQTDCVDPYKDKKRQSNDIAKSLAVALHHEVAAAENRLETAVRFAIAGNIIDYGAYKDFDLEGALSRSRSNAFAVDHFNPFKAAVKSLEKGANVLYLLDNCGEVVFDSFLLEYLFELGVNLTIVVKDGPIINDALEEDAYFAGLDKFGTIISNGSRCPGTVLDECSAQFLDIFSSTDLVIAKGQGNFESLSHEPRNIFFLLTIKCEVAADHMVHLSGIDKNKLPGKGEMAVYFSGKNK